MNEKITKGDSKSKRTRANISFRQKKGGGTWRINLCSYRRRWEKYFSFCFRTTSPDKLLAGGKKKRKEKSEKEKARKRENKKERKRERKQERK